MKSNSNQNNTYYELSELILCGDQSFSKEMLIVNYVILILGPLREYPIAPWFTGMVITAIINL